MSLALTIIGWLIVGGLSGYAAFTIFNLIGEARDYPRDDIAHGDIPHLPDEIRSSHSEKGA